MKDKVEFTIKNLNREKILKEIIKIANVSDVKIEEENIKFCVNKKKSKKVEKLLEKKYVKIGNKRVFGILSYIKKNVLKIGIIIPVIIFSIFILICNNFVFRCEILGLELIDKSEVYGVLDDCGLQKINHKSNIDTKLLEQKILKIDKVSLVSCIIKGNTLIINIKEKIYNPEFEDKDSFKPIKSLYNGIITNLSVVQGTAKVVVGQTVKIGDVLVEPYVIDTSGNILSVKPMADIKADVFYNTITEVAENQIVYQDTNKIIEKREMYIGNNKIFDNQKSCTFKYYKTEVIEKHVGEKNLLPIKYVKTIFTEQKQVLVDNYFTINKQEILNQCQQKTRQLIDEYDIIKEQYHKITNVAGINRVSYTIVVNKSLVMKN